jgi:hypothetical protein
MKKGMLVLNKKKLASGKTAYYVLGKEPTAGDIYALYWDFDVQEWKHFKDWAMLYERVFFDTDYDWEPVAEDELPAPVPPELRGPKD